MSRPNRIRFVRNILYRLKQNYGLNIDYYRCSSSNTNYETGLQTPSVIRYKVKKAIRLPSRFHKDFDYGITYLAANKNFAYGAQYDKNKRIIIIDKKHISIVPEIDDYIIVETLRYDVKEVFRLDLNLGFLLVVEHIEGTPKFEVQAVSQVLSLTQSIIGVKE